MALAPVDSPAHDLQGPDDDLVERAEFGHDEQCRAKHGDPRKHEPLHAKSARNRPRPLL